MLLLLALRSVVVYTTKITLILSCYHGKMQHRMMIGMHAADADAATISVLSIVGVRIMMAFIMPAFLIAAITDRCRISFLLMLPLAECSLCNKSPWVISVQTTATAAVASGCCF